MHGVYRREREGSLGKQSRAADVEVEVEVEVKVQREEEGESGNKGCVLKKRSLTKGQRGAKIKMVMLVTEARCREIGLSVGPTAPSTESELTNLKDYLSSEKYIIKSSNVKCVHELLS